MPLSYGAASVHYQLVDAASGRLVADIDSVRHARPWNIPPWETLQSFRRLGQANVLLKTEARSLRKDLKRLARLSRYQTPANTPAVAAGQ